MRRKGYYIKTVYKGDLCEPRTEREQARMEKKADRRRARIAYRFLSRIVGSVRRLFG